GLERLGRLVQRLDAADRVPLLRQEDDVGAARRALRDEALGLGEVLGLVAPARELDAGDADPVGHGERIALGAWKPSPRPPVACASSTPSGTATSACSGAARPSRSSATWP